MPFADRIGLGMMAAVSDALERVGIGVERAKERVRQAQEEEQTMAADEVGICYGLRSFARMHKWILGPEMLIGTSV